MSQQKMTKMNKKIINLKTKMCEKLLMKFQGTTHVLFVTRK